MLAFEQQRFADGRGERPAVDRGDDLQRIQHPEHRTRMAPLSRPVVVAVQRQRVGAGVVSLRCGGRHAHGLQVVQHPGLVAGFFVDVFVKKMADGLQRLVSRRAHAAGRHGAHRVEVPHHLVQLEQQRAVALHRHAFGHRPHHHGVGLETTAVFVGAGDQLGKERQHQTSPTLAPGDTRVGVRLSLGQTPILQFAPGSAPRQN